MPLSRRNWRSGILSVRAAQPSRPCGGRHSPAVPRRWSVQGRLLGVSEALFPDAVGAVGRPVRRAEEVATGADTANRREAPATLFNDDRRHGFPPNICSISLLRNRFSVSVRSGCSCAGSLGSARLCVIAGDRVCLNQADTYHDREVRPSELLEGIQAPLCEKESPLQSGKERTLVYC